MDRGSERSFDPPESERPATEQIRRYPLCADSPNNQADSRRPIYVDRHGDVPRRHVVRISWNARRQPVSAALETYAVELQRTPRVYEIPNARAWTDLVTTYPREYNSLIYPDWQQIETQYDAVHMTLRAIFAMQGLRLRTEAGVVAETYWDVESTLWLRWVFDATIELVATSAG